MYWEGGPPLVGGGGGGVGGVLGVPAGDGANEFERVGVVGIAGSDALDGGAVFH